jgi:hypothetical protein
MAPPRWKYDPSRSKSRPCGGHAARGCDPYGQLAPRGSAGSAPERLAASPGEPRSGTARCSNDVLESTRGKPERQPDNVHRTADDKHPRGLRLPEAQRAGPGRRYLRQPQRDATTTRPPGRSGDATSRPPFRPPSASQYNYGMSSAESKTTMEAGVVKFARFSVRDHNRNLLLAPDVRLQTVPQPHVTLSFPRCSASPRQ